MLQARHHSKWPQLHQLQWDCHVRHQICTGEHRELFGLGVCIDIRHNMPQAHEFLTWGALIMIDPYELYAYDTNWAWYDSCRCF